MKKPKHYLELALGILTFFKKNYCDVYNTMHCQLSPENTLRLFAAVTV